MGGCGGVGVHVRSSPSERRRYTQLLRYSTQEAAREKLPRRSRHELIQGPLSNLRVPELRVYRWQKGKVVQECCGDLQFVHLILECPLPSPSVESNEAWPRKSTVTATDSLKAFENCA